MVNNDSKEWTLSQLEDKILFAEMINTRFCHDIAGPISAVNNGLEFFEDESDPEVREQAVDLLRLSSRESFTKLQMYRMAYGRAAHAAESNVSELKEIVFRYFEQGKVTLDWPESPEDGFQEKINNEIRQLLVNMILMMAGQLVYGGTLKIRKEIGEKQRQLVVCGLNNRLRDDKDIDYILSGQPVDEYTPQNAPTCFFVLLAEQRKAEIRFQREAEKLELRVTYE